MSRPWACAALFATVGFFLRAATALLWPTIHRPDETFQNLEPAYRLLSGWGVVSWEWREGIRSWLFPDFLYAIMRAAALLHLPLGPAITVVLSAVAATGVAAATLVGWVRYGLSGAVLCGTLAAVWPDLVYFGPKPLLEVQAGTLLVLAAALGSLDRPRPREIGVLLGLAFALRFQLAPALAIVAIGATWREPKRMLPLLAAAALPVLLLGLIDWMSWGSPFQSIWKNIQINFVHNRSEIYGVEPVSWYATELIARYGLASIPLALCFGVGIRAAPLLAITSVVVVVFHSLIAHKEISFVYAALPCALLVAGLGATRLLQALSTSRPAITAAALACTATALLAAQAAQPFREPSAQPELRALWSILRTRPDLCGLALYSEAPFPWVRIPGYVGLERPIPVYMPQGPEALARAAPGFNYLIADMASTPALPDGERITCTGEFCLLRRDQACQPVPDLDVNAVLRRADQ